MGMCRKRSRLARTSSGGSSRIENRIRCFQIRADRKMAAVPGGDRMLNVSEMLANREVAPGQLAIYWLCQAGFAFKSSSKEVVFIDPYFTDLVERLVGFKRMMPCPIKAE